MRNAYLRSDGGDDGVGRDLFVVLADQEIDDIQRRFNDIVRTDLMRMHTTRQKVSDDR